MSSLRGLLEVLDTAAVGYLVIIVATNAVLGVLAVVSVVQATLRRGRPSRRDFSTTMWPPVAVLVPARDEAAVIGDCVRSLMAQEYPDFVVVVVDDGSVDGTGDAVRSLADLRPAAVTFDPRVVVQGRVLGVERQVDDGPMWLITKEGVGRRGDALQAGLSVVEQPLVCMIDADTVLEPRALLLAAEQFLRSGPRTVGVGAPVVAANGCTVRAGAVERVGMPATLLERSQVLEYLRAFLVGRVGWARLGGLGIISGAFGMFRTEDVVARGGIDSDTLAEDAELVIALHERLRRTGEPYRMAMLHDRVCWTQVPSRWGDLYRQRWRWSRGLAEVLWKHRRMIANPRFGRIGLVVLPYYTVVELLSPVVEVLGALAVVLGVALGAVHAPTAVALVGLVATLSLLQSALTLFVEELIEGHRGRSGGTIRSLGAALGELVVVRPMVTVARLHGLLGLRRGRPIWATPAREPLRSPPGAAGSVGSWNET